MELLQLKYFQTVARLEHMTRAADALHISQPSLSKSIHRLEKNLGVQLFDREGKQIKLNQFGKAFYMRVEKILSDINEAVEEVQDMAGLDRGSVLLGATTTRLLPDLLNSYLAQFPYVNIQLLQVGTKEIQARLEKNEIDLCISCPPIEAPGFQCVPLITEEIFLAVPPNHPLASRSNIHISEVANEPFVSLTTDYDLREICSRYCQMNGFTPHVAFESNDPEMIMTMVRTGLGMAFVPSYWWKGEQRTLPTQLKIDGGNFTRIIGLSWKESRYLSSAARELRQFIIHYFSKLEQRNDSR